MFDTKKAYKLYNPEVGVPQAAKDYCKKVKIPFEEKYIHRLRRYIYSLGGDDMGDYSALDSSGNLLTPEQVCEIHNLDFSTVKKASLIAHTNNKVYNFQFAYEHEEKSIDKEFFEGVVKDLAKSKKYTVKPVKNSKTFDRVIITDVHVGMDTSGNINTTPVYDDPWNAEVLEKRRKEMCDYIISKRKSDTLYLDDLGDAADGVGGFTSRGGHKLPQNMSDREIFNTLIQFRVRILDQLTPHYKKIVCNLVMESNHGTKIDQMSGDAFKLYAETVYKNVEVVLHDKFMSHYAVGKNTFIICHGKDSSEQKFGFKPILEHKGERKIDEYCQVHSLINGNRIEFSKGDSHQAIFDYTTSRNYCYMSYPCFATNSNWVKMNFQNGSSGFVMQTCDVDGKDREQSIYFFS